MDKSSLSSDDTGAITIPPRWVSGPLLLTELHDVDRPRWQNGYRRIEILERFTRHETVAEYGDLVRPWLRCIDLTLQIFLLMEDVSPEARIELDDSARELRFRLAAIGFGAMKVGLDNAIGGFYAQAWGQIRFLAECTIQMIHARRRPATAVRWFQYADEMLIAKQELRCEQAINAIDSKAASYLTELERVDWDEVKLLYKVGHKGAHPTAQFLWQSAGDESGDLLLGTRFRSDAARLTLFCGFEAAFILLRELIRTETSDQFILGKFEEMLDEYIEVRSAHEERANEDIASLIGTDNDDSAHDGDLPQ